MSRLLTFRPRFLNVLRFEDRGGFPFILTHALRYVTDIDSRGTFDVPAGFPTDLASIPKILWNILHPVGRYDAAAVVHDYLYAHGLLNGKPITRAQADAILNEAMTVCGVGKVTRFLIYAGVRIGGWVVWNKYRGRDCDHQHLQS